MPTFSQIRIPNNASHTTTTLFQERGATLWINFQRCPETSNAQMFAILHALNFLESAFIDDLCDTKQVGGMLYFRYIKHIYLYEGDSVK